MNNATAPAQAVAFPRPSMAIITEQLKSMVGPHQARGAQAQAN